MGLSMTKIAPLTYMAVFERTIEVGNSRGSSMPYLGSILIANRLVLPFLSINCHRLISRSGFDSGGNCLALLSF